MTAIAGYWSLDDRPDAAGSCQRMLNSQQVYGPQAPALATDGPIALGQRLFGLFPEERRKQKVAAGASGETLLVADVRLDNREELGAALGMTGAETAGLTDAALLLHALERWDEAAVERVQGDFAFAFWDRRRQRLLLARDFLGQRPLHYSRGRGYFAFASMPKGLHALSEVPVAPDCEAVAGFLALMPEHGSETFFHGVSKVRSGEIVTVTRDGLKSRLWWQPALRDLGLKSPDDYAEALREHLDRAVEARLRGAEDKVAAHLSAGLDSSAVAATAARLLAPSGGRVTGFTAVPRAGYSEEVFEAITDEGPLAAQVAALYPNMEQVLVDNVGSPVAPLDRYFYLYERPVLNLCNSVWGHKIMAEARDSGHKVLLTGNSGNMSFSYDGMPLLTQLARSGRMLRLARESLALIRGGTRVGTVAAQVVAPFLPRAAWRAIRHLRGKGRDLTDYTAISSEAIETYRIRERAAERGLDLTYRPRRDPLETRLWVMRRVDLGNYMKGHLAGWNVDVRDPTADRRLVEFCLAVPADQYLRSGVRRALARRAFADRLPAALLGERRKGYQGVDWHEGLTAGRGELGQELESIGNCRESRSTLDVAMVKGLMESWPEGGWNQPAVLRKYRSALLRGVSAGHFARKAAGSNR